MTDTFLTEKDFCDYDTTMELEKIGMPAHDSGSVHCSLYKAQKWLRLQGLNIDVRYNNIYNYYFVTLSYYTNWTDTLKNGQTCKLFDDYETALSEAITYGIECLKNLNPVVLREALI